MKDKIVIKLWVRCLLSEWATDTKLWKTLKAKPFNASRMVLREICREMTPLFYGTIDEIALRIGVEQSIEDIAIPEVEEETYKILIEVDKQIRHIVKHNNRTT